MALPSKLERGATSFPIRYADPWGGKILSGSLGADGRVNYPGLLATVPSSRFGKDKVRKDEASIVSLSAAIGAF